MTAGIPLQQAGHPAAAWAASNPVLLDRQIGIETDTRKLKLGDGATAWNSLPYNIASAADVPGLPAALASLAPLVSPPLTGTPTAPTAPASTANTQLATTAFVALAIAAVINSAPGALDTLKELADAIGDDPNFAATLTAAIGGKLAKASNLSDLTNAVSARANLGLGSAAVASTGTSGGTVPLLNVANTWSASQFFSMAALCFQGELGFPGAASGNAYFYRSNAFGMTMYGQGTNSDFYIGNRAGTMAMQVEPNSTSIRFGGAAFPNADNAASHGTVTNRWANSFAKQFRPGAGAVIWTSGAGTPLGSVTAPVGSLYTRTDGGAGTTLYVKESGTDATGWVAK